MLPVRVKVTRNFLTHLTRRMNKWRGRVLTGVLTVPPELAWWYWQEFGVPADNINPILARDSNLLVFVKGGVTVFTPSVPSAKVGRHPGLEPKHIVSSVATDQYGNKAGHEMLKHVDNAVQTKKALDNVDEMRAAVERALERIKEMIVERMGEQLPGSTEPHDSRFPKQAGKLGGRKAADVFKDESEIKFR